MSDRRSYEVPSRIGEFMPEERDHTTRCKHGWGDCETCGTSDRMDVIHRARTPDKRTARRLKRHGR